MSDRPLQASFICGGTHVPASRFRVHPIVERLDAEGWTTQLLHGYGPMDQRLTNGLLRRGYRAACRAARAYRTASMVSSGPVLVQRLALPWYSVPEQRLARNCSGLIFDFDDAVFLDGSGSDSKRRRNALAGVFASASHVVAGNSWLAETVSANVPISVIPTCIDTKVYVPPAIRTEESRVRIGWIGTEGNLKYLEQLVAPLSRLRAGGYNFDFIVCSDVPNPSLLKSLKAQFQKWSPLQELPFLQSLDIGLMPLADDVWCRGKCSFKLIQYMAVGCPVVASSVGLNKDAVRDGVDGFLVSGGGWEEPLAELISSAERRTRFGLEARSSAVSNFDISIAFSNYQKILESFQ